MHLWSAGRTRPEVGRFGFRGSGWKWSVTSGKKQHKWQIDQSQFVYSFSFFGKPKVWVWVLLFFRVLDFIFPSLKEVHGQGVSVLSLGKNLKIYIPYHRKTWAKTIRLSWSCRVLVWWVCLIMFNISTDSLYAKGSLQLSHHGKSSRLCKLKGSPRRTVISSLSISPSPAPHGCSLPRWLGQSTPRHPGTRWEWTSWMKILHRVV